MKEKLTPGQKLAQAMKETGLPYETITVKITPEMEETDKWIRNYLRMIDQAQKSTKRANIVFR